MSSKRLHLGGGTFARSPLGASTQGGEVALTAGQDFTAETLVQLNGEGKLSAIGGNIEGDAGVAEVFENSGSYYISVAALSETKAIVTYQDSGSLYYGTACVLDISGSTVTAGTPVVFEYANAEYTSVAALSSTKAIVAYQDGGNSDYGTARILDISGSTIIPRTPEVFESALTRDISVTALSSAQAVVTYKDSGNSGRGTACLLDVSNSTITARTPQVFESGGVSGTSVSTLSPYEAIVTYQDSGNSFYGTACMLNILGSSLTTGTPAVFASTSTYETSVTALSETKAVVTYRDSGNSGYGTACVLNVSGSTITAGTPEVFESASTNYISVTALSETKVFVAYQDSGNSGYGTACVLNVSGSELKAETPVVYNTAGTGTPSVNALSETKAIVTYGNSGSFNYGTAKSLTFFDEDSTVGVVTGAALEDTKVNLKQRGILSGLSGLIPGTRYYADTRGAISATKSGALVGTAVSTTEILLKGW